MARRPVPDHRIQRVDRLVGRDPRQPGNSRPEQRSHHPVRGVFGQAFDTGAGQGGCVGAAHVAADDLRGRAARALKIACGQGPRDSTKMMVQGSRRDQRPGKEARNEGPQQALQDQRRDDGGRDHHQRRRGAPRHPRAAPVPAPVQRRDQPAQPAYRMTDAAEQGVGPSDCHIQRQRGQGDQRSHGGVMLTASTDQSPPDRRRIVSDSGATWNDSAAWPTTSDSPARTVPA